MEPYFLYFDPAKKWTYFEIDPVGNRSPVTGHGSSPAEAIDDYTKRLPEFARLHRKFFLDRMAIRH